MSKFSSLQGHGILPQPEIANEECEIPYPEHWKMPAESPEGDILQVGGVGHILRVTNHISRAPLNQALKINLNQRAKPLCKLQVYAMKAENLCWQLQVSGIFKCLP